MGVSRWMVRGIRGAITVDENTREAIVGAAKELVQRILSENNLESSDIASLFFTATPDLNAEFPAVGAREAGLDRVPLMCSVEMGVPGSQHRCIRVLLHANTTLSQEEIRHVYLREAKSLRPDLT